MEAWKQYILSIIACSICIGIVSQILSESGAKGLVRLVGGIVLAVTILRPVSRIEFDQLTDISAFDQLSAQDFVDNGKNIAAEKQALRITETCEAYILDKAEKLGAEILAEIVLDEEQIPCCATIQGDVDPIVQQRLEIILETDLGITKENQQWTGNQEKSSS